MALQFFSQPSKLIRFALTGLMATQAAIALTALAEFAITTPNSIHLQTASAQPRQETAERIIDKAGAAVVFVQTNKGSGSGVILDSSGLIVTNAHVIEGAKKIMVTLPNQPHQKIEAEVVAIGRSSRCLDLALLRLPGQRHLPTVNLAAAGSVRRGQQAFAIGYPHSTVPSTITQGIISNVGNIAPHLIQTDASLTFGNSGGALLNDRAELIGINTSGSEGNMNNAISAETVRSLVQGYRQGVVPIMSQLLIPMSQSSSLTLPKLALNVTTINSQLQAGDSLWCSDGSFADVYTFEAKADQPIKLNVLSREIGSFLMLIGPNGQIVAESPNGKPNQTVSIVENLPQTGTYTLVVDAAAAGQTGRYQLQASLPYLVEQARIDDRTPSCLKDGSPCRNYVFKAKAGSTTIQFHQSEFDPYILLLNAAGEVVVKRQVNRQGAITIDLPKDGQYQLIVSTVNPSDRGKFFLSVQPSTEKPSQVSQSR